jgi:hypothetical protein
MPTLTLRNLQLRRPRLVVANRHFDDTVEFKSSPWHESYEWLYNKQKRENAEMGINFEFNTSQPCRFIRESQLKRSSTSAQCISAAQRSCIIAPKLIREIDSGGIGGIKAVDYESRQKQDQTSIVIIREKAVAELPARL